MASDKSSTAPRSDIDWASLGFNYMPVNTHIKYIWKDGKWDGGTLSAEHTITLPIAATCLHYGQAAFEGLKAFRCKDGKIRIFRPDENSARMNMTAEHLLGPTIPTETFIDATRRVVRDNAEFVPPYGSGGSLYIRPLYIGTGSQIGVAPSKTYEFLIMVMPVGPYYKGGMQPVPALIIEDYDRAAPRGTGHIKVAGNYGASLKPSKIAKDRHFPITLFLDPKEHEYVDEFGTSNFFAITKDGKYVTPDSPSILGSVTNKSIMQIAKDCGLKVERRKIHYTELKDFAEVGACGTAVVITPISQIVHGDKVYKYSEKSGPVLKMLYDRMLGIQYGELPDTHHWMFDL